MPSWWAGKRASSHQKQEVHILIIGNWDVTGEYMTMGL